MCPACATTAVLIATGTASGGGFAAWLARRLHLKSRTRKEQ